MAIYHYPSLTAGGDTFIFDFSSFLVQQGHEVHIITSNQLPLISGKKNLTTYEVLDNIGGANLYELPFLTIFPHPSSFPIIRNILRMCDVIYVKNELFELFQLKILKSRLNIPTICGIHTAVYYPYGTSLRSKIHNDLYSSKLYEYLLHQYNAIHVLNNYDLNLMKNHFNVKEKLIFKIPMGVNTNLFSPNTQKELIQGKDKFRILFLGKLDEQKGFDVFRDAIHMLQTTKQFDQMEFTIVGSGELVEIATTLVQNYTNVNFLGFVSQDLIVDLYNSHDVVVVPSRWETLSYVCLEAQSCGIPVIATDIPGPNGIIKPGDTGILIPSENSNALVHAILDLYKIKKEAVSNFQNMKKSSRDNVLQNFSFEKMMFKLEFLLKQF